MKRQREKEGDFVSIPLGNDYHSYARIIAGKFYAFYNIKTTKNISLEEIKLLDVLFVIAVHRSVVTQGRWKIIGNELLEPKFKVHPVFFMQDILNKNIVHLYKNGEMIPTTIENCRGYEKFMVWDANQVEERLNDHFLNKENIHLSMHKLKE